MTLLAGASAADITPPPGVMMDGYGGRTTPSQGVHDPLMARVLVLDQDGQRGAVVSCDLLGMHIDVTRSLRERLAREHGLNPDGVVVAATHNHAGPAGLRGGMFSRLDARLAELFVERVCSAAGEAAAALAPATMKLGCATVETVSMNRRDPEGPAEREMRVLLFDGEHGPVASMVNFACHATVLDGSNLLLSGEFIGAAARLVREATGAPCVYINGACGDVNPAWVRQDFANVDRVGRIVGGQALRTIGELQALGPGQRVHNIRWDEFPELPVSGRIVRPRLRFRRREVELHRREFLEDAVYAERIASARSEAAGHPALSAARREAMAQVSRWESERWAAAWARRTGETVTRTEVQAIGLGDGLGLIALPGEFFTQTARAIRDAQGPADTLVACYANDYVGYVVPADDYDRGGYETGITFFGPEAEPIIVEAAREALREATGGN